MAVPDPKALHELREAHSKGILLGLKGVSGVKERLDIDVLLLEHPQTFNLFLLALDKIQNDPDLSNVKMSYFQIAGIHGLPQELWDNLRGKRDNFTDAKEGYCAHSSDLFPTWHRPYMAIMEQTLYLQMLDIAESYNEPHRHAYLEAAQLFRLPYWDFHRPREERTVVFPGVVQGQTTSFPFDYSVPKILSESSIMVRMPPHDRLERLDHNPLSSFAFSKFKIVDEEWDSLFKSIKEGKTKDKKEPSEELKEQRRQELKYKLPREQTVRYPKSPQEHHEKWGHGTERLNRTMNELRMDTNRLVLCMMNKSKYDVYEAFSSNLKNASVQNIPVEDTNVNVRVSLEGLHNTYHVMIGGLPYPGEDLFGGHMSQVPLAAFDPIFWVYHCQIDRLFAIWQAIRDGKDESWFAHQEMAQMGLLPFRKQLGDDSSACWTSDDWRACHALGSSYPDLKYKGRDALEHHRYLYEWSVPLLSKEDFSRPPAEMKPLDLSHSEFFVPRGKREPTESIPDRVTNLQLEPKASLNSKGDYVTSIKGSDGDFSKEWFIDDQVQRLALNGAFSILYFVMDEPRSLPTDADFAMEPTLAGVTHIFAAPQQACSNCSRQAEQATVVTNTVPITSLLLDYVTIGKLQSLDPEHVKPFLIKGLKWRIISVDARIQDPRHLAKENDFQVGVSCKVARLPRGSDHVEYFDYPEITAEIIRNASNLATA